VFSSSTRQQASERPSDLVSGSTIGLRYIVEQQQGEREKTERGERNNKR
jgi:hypothetical protein